MLPLEPIASGVAAVFIARYHVPIASRMLSYWYSGVGSDSFQLSAPKHQELPHLFASATIPSCFSLSKLLGGRHQQHLPTQQPLLPLQT